MRAPPASRRVAEPVGYENLGQADGIANYDQGHSHPHGHHGHAHRHGLGHHAHAHDSDAYVNSDTNANAEPCSRRYRG